jgi:hypothetical protein
MLYPGKIDRHNRPVRLIFSLQFAAVFVQVKPQAAAR